MKTLYAQLLIIAIIAMVTLLINFRFTMPKDVKQKKEMIIKTIYIPSSPAPVDSIQKDSMENSFLKKEVIPYQNYSKYYRSKHIHKKGYIS